MLLEKNKVVVRSLVEVLNKKDLSLLDDLVAPDYFDHTFQRDLEETKRNLDMLCKGFPDFQMTMSSWIAER